MGVFPHENAAARPPRDTQQQRKCAKHSESPFGLSLWPALPRYPTWKTVISTAAQRSGETCNFLGAPNPNLVNPPPPPKTPPTPTTPTTYLPKNSWHTSYAPTRTIKEVDRNRSRPGALEPGLFACPAAFCLSAYFLLVIPFVCHSQTESASRRRFRLLGLNPIFTNTLRPKYPPRGVVHE
jgi:hypothetical protein